MMEPNTNLFSGFLSLIAFSHCSGREHHVSNYLLVGIEGCGYNDKLVFSLLIITIVGGAIAPVIMWYIADFPKTYPSFLKEGSTFLTKPSFLRDERM